MVTSCSVKGCKSKAGQGIKFHRLPKGKNREAWIKFLKSGNPFFVPTIHNTNVCGLHFSSDLDYEIAPTSIYQTKRLKKTAVPRIMNQNICESLLSKPNQEFNHDAEEDVTLSSPDLYAGLKSVPPAIPLPVVYESYLLLKPIQNTSIVPPAPVIQNRNETPPIPVVQNEVPPSFEQNTDDEILLTPNNKRKCFLGDFKEPSDIDSPNSRLKYWIASQSTVISQQKKIKFLYKQTANLKMKIKKLENLINQLKNEKKKDSNNRNTAVQELILSSSQHEIYMSMCKPI